jgi:hypothetical protein
MGHLNSIICKWQDRFVQILPWAFHPTFSCSISAYVGMKGVPDRKREIHTIRHWYYYIQSTGKLEVASWRLDELTLASNEKQSMSSRQ